MTIVSRSILSYLFFVLPALAFVINPGRTQHVHRKLHTAAFSTKNSNDGDDVGVVAVKATDLDESLGLSPEERIVVNIHRVCSPSVVYVTSVATTRRRDGKKTTTEDRNKLPNGMSLGSGSGFVVDTEGYIVTNYHVVQRAYESNQAVLQYEKFWDDLAKNTTKNIKDKLYFSNSNIVDNVENAVNRTVNAITGKESKTDNVLPARVYVRFGENGDGDENGVTSYHYCEIVDVMKELDIAVLKMNSTTKVNNLKAMEYGVSSNLVVGQSLLAIGNPFGLDRTITSGLVSALGRSVTGVAGNKISNCIQTDCAINPGNSGGPLLNLKGEVVGVNTMIITTSGSSAGIGFAVPGDSVKESTDKIIELDKQKRLRSAKRKGRGWLGVSVATSALEESLRNRLLKDNKSSGNKVVGTFITAIAPKSPFMLQQQQEEEEEEAGRDPSPPVVPVATTNFTNGTVEIGDRIVSVGGNPIENANAFLQEMKGRVEGENLSLTLEREGGDRRVIYVTLGQIPL